MIQSVEQETSSMFAQSAKSSNLFLTTYRAMTFVAMALFFYIRYFSIVFCICSVVSGCRELSNVAIKFSPR